MKMAVATELATEVARNLGAYFHRLHSQTGRTVATGQDQHAALAGLPA